MFKKNKAVGCENTISKSIQRRGRGGFSPPTANRMGV